MTLPRIAQLDFPTDNIEQESSVNTVHKTFAWDFEKGDFLLKDGKVVEVEGIEYIRIWIQKALSTVKNSLIYVGTNYGSEHHTLIGRNFHPDFTRAEFERMIREALLENEAILRVENFSFSNKGSKLTILFDVHSIYGATGEAVIV